MRFKRQHKNVEILIKEEQEQWLRYSKYEGVLLRLHYENTPIHIYWKFYHQQMKIFR